ncbi:MAG: hypothetical protein ACTHOU_14920 [Aureliella sp.]
MPMRKLVISFMLLSTVTCGMPARTAQAGPLFDWLFFGHHRQPAAPAYAVGYPVPVATGYAPYVAGYVPYASAYAPYASAYAPYAARYAPTVAVAPQAIVTSPVVTAPTMAAPAVTAPTVTGGYGTYYGANLPVVGGAGYGYLAQRPAETAIAAAPAVVPSTAPVTLVPDYRTTTSRTPVTYYRPLMTTDPTTGAQVVTMAPCTSYEYQTQRVPTLGLTQVYNGGATLPATTAVAPPVSPTYTLPRGGVPLAGPLPSTQPYATAYGTYPAPGTTTVTPVAPTTGSIITPATPATPYSAGYSAYAANPSNYSTLQPTVGVSPGSVYATSPLGSSPASGLSPYYNSTPTTSGGSCGNVAPQSLGSTGSAPLSTSPYATTPGTLAPGTVLPGGVPSGTVAPGTSLPTSPVLPPGSVGAPSSDPAAGAQPTLPLPGQSSARLDSRPQLQSVVQQPIPGARSTVNSASPLPSRDSKPGKSPGSSLMPIPVPDDFDHQPRWNPGLLNEQDQTAANAEVPSRSPEASRNPSAAWGSKSIHWASFKEPKSASTLESPADAGFDLQLSAPRSQLRDIDAIEEIQPRDAQPANARPGIAQPAMQQPAMQRPAAPEKLVPGNVQMVPIERAVAPAAAPGLELAPSNPAGNSSAPQRGRYDTSGWQ